MANGFEISRDTWEHMPHDQREWILFETMQKMNTRLKTLEKWAWAKMTLMFLGSTCGGAIMMMVFNSFKVKPV